MDNLYESVKRQKKSVLNNQRTQKYTLDGFKNNDDLAKINMAADEGINNTNWVELKTVTEHLWN